MPSLKLKIKAPAKKKPIATEIDEYIAKQPKMYQNLLKKVQACIRKAVPEASEKVSYGLATFYLHGNLVHFGLWKKHLGFYATPNGHSAFKKELSKYEGAKGSVKFPLDQEIPFVLIARIAKFRAKQNRVAAKHS